MKKVLLTSVCRPLGERYGDGSSVGYELLFGQVTRAQGLFSPRANHIYYSLEYVAENLDAPTTVLHYPSKRELIKELKKGYDVVGVSFLLAIFHRMKEVVEIESVLIQCKPRLLRRAQSRWGYQRGEAEALPFGRTRGFKPRV